MNDVESPKTKKDVLLAARAQRQAKLDLEQEAHDLLVLELEQKYSDELGVRKRAFEIVNEENAGGVGPIVVKLGDPTVHKRFVSKRDPSYEDVFQYVAPAVVYPAREVFSEIVTTRPQILYVAASAVTDLYGWTAGERAKK